MEHTQPGVHRQERIRTEQSGGRVPQDVMSPRGGHPGLPHVPVPQARAAHCYWGPNHEQGLPAHGPARHPGQAGDLRITALDCHPCC
jgi:hypothetical protein